MGGKTLSIIAVVVCGLVFAGPVAAKDASTGNPNDTGALQPGMQRSDDGKWYVGARAGATNLQRKDFKYGQIAMDANDCCGDPRDSISSPNLKLNPWGGGSQFFAGMQLSETSAVEARFGFALFDEDDKTRLFPDGDDDGMNYFVPYLDGGRYPNSDRELTAGVYGVRYKDEKGPVDLRVKSDTDFFDAGIDFVNTHVDHEGCTFQSVVGPAFIYFNQDIHHTVMGDAIGGWSKPTTIRTHEEMTEYYAGAKLGFRTSYAFPEDDHISLVVHGDVSLLYHHSDLDARQNIADDLSIKVSDEEDAFAAKIGALAGVDFEVIDGLNIGLFYEFGAYLNASNIVNPRLQLVYLEDDYRWAGAQKARLGEQDLLTHGAVMRLIYRF